MNLDVIVSSYLSSLIVIVSSVRSTLTLQPYISLRKAVSKSVWLTSKPCKAEIASTRQRLANLAWCICLILVNAINLLISHRNKPNFVFMNLSILIFNDPIPIQSPTIQFCCLHRYVFYRSSDDHQSHDDVYL